MCITIMVTKMVTIKGYSKRETKVKFCKLLEIMVPEAGIEPAWGCPRGILSPIPDVYGGLLDITGIQL